MSLTFERDAEGRSYLARQYASYPFHVCRAQYLDREPAGLATLYIQSCSGGLYDGDRLAAEIHVGPGAQAHVTTQASTIVHRTRSDAAAQSVEITVADGGLLEYLPDPNILFPQSRYRSKLRLRLAAGGRAMVSEAFLGHDPDGVGQVFDSFKSETAVVDGHGALRVLDRMSVEGAAAAAGRRGLMGANRAQATVLLLGGSADREGTASALRLAVGALAGVFAGLSALPHDMGLGVRILAVDGDSLRRALFAIWSEGRRGFVGHEPAERKK